MVDFPLGPPVSSLSTLIHSETHRLESLSGMHTDGRRKHQTFTPQLP